MPSAFKALRTVLAACVAMLLLTSVGCHFTETLWSEQVSSPDGKWLALARTDNVDTIGNEEFTIVSLKEKGFWHRPKQLIVFEGIDYEQDFHIAWTSSSSLEVSVPEDIRVVKGEPSDPGVSLLVTYLPKRQQATRK